VGQAAQGKALPIRGQDPAFPEWWQVDFNGSAAWVFGPLVTTGGPMEQIVMIGAAPNGNNSVASAESLTSTASFSAAIAPAGPQIDPNYQPVLPYLAR
jgi:hypothetical protein